ncbi:MAG: J domain-containing protein [Chloroflexota bacterium]|nr:J domain-containing protein [Chloroflexota bacterium]
MKQFVLDHLTQHLSSSERIARFQRECDAHDLLVTLTDGTAIAICVINRAIRLTEVRERYEKNTRAQVHTLFIIDGRMMPADSDAVAPPAWMAALHTLTLGRIYGYWCEGRDVTIRPMHMEWKWGGSPRAVEYGETIAVDMMRGERLQTGTKEIDGDFAVAYFGEGAFWKQHNSAEEAQFDYSWRSWAYSGAKREAPPQEERQNTWDSWEEFQRRYADRGAKTGDWSWSGDRTDNARRTARPTNSVSRYYALLGVPATASIDEVKQAYRRMARAYHPDLHPAEKEKYTAKMADINTAFEAIVKAKQ